MARPNVTCLAFLLAVSVALKAVPEESTQTTRHESYLESPSSLSPLSVLTLEAATAARGNLSRWRDDERQRLGAFQIEPFDPSNPSKARATTNALPSVGGYFAYFGDELHPGGVVQSTWTDPSSDVDQPSRLFGARYANPYQICGGNVPLPDLQIADLTYLGPSWRPEFDTLDAALGLPPSERQVSAGAPIEHLVQPLVIDGANPMLLYPSRASDRGIEGAAVLACRIKEDLALQCGVRSETPPGWGFGEAAIRVASYAHASPGSLGDDHPEGRCVNLTIPFRLSH